MSLSNFKLTSMAITALLCSCNSDAPSPDTMAVDGGAADAMPVDGGAADATRAECTTLCAVLVSCGQFQNDRECHQECAQTLQGCSNNEWMDLADCALTPTCPEFSACLDMVPCTEE